MDPIRVGDILDGKYQIEGTLGEGAMGVVFSARHTALNKRVAVKTLRPEIARDQNLVGRFEQEARAASAIGHPNIIEVFDLGSAPNGARYMVMEHLRGESLAEVIIRDPIQSPSRVVNYMMQTLSALAAAHKRGIVHRDLKPENIFVVRIEDRPDTIKLLDFGISKVLAEVADPRIAGGDSGARKTVLGTVLGTPLYMSPEQARGLIDIDHRTDLWAVAVCMYEMLTGRPPFDGTNYNQIMGAILQGEFRPPRAFNPEVPEALERVILKGLEYQREKRFQSASEMRKALDKAAVGVTLPAPKPAKAATRALHRGATPPPAAAASITPPPGVPKPEVRDSPTGLAAAAGASGASDAAMLSALDRIATGGEVDLGFAAASQPFLDSPPSKPDAPTMPAPAPASAPAGAPTAVEATPRPEVMKAPAKAAAAAVDLFAPPDSEDEDLDLDISVSEPARPARPQAIGTAQVARGSQGGAAAATEIVAPAAPRSSGAGASVGKLIVWLAVLVVVGGGGFAGYRYATLGYVLSPPQTPRTVVALAVTPATGELIVDQLAYPARELELEQDKPRVVRAMATGRLQQEVRLLYTGEPIGPQTFRLSYQLVPWTVAMAPASADDAGPAAAAGMDAHDVAVHKLDLFRSCLAPLGEQLAQDQKAYLQVTRGKANAIEKNNIPRVKPLGSDVLSGCRTATQAAAADQPAFPEIDPAMLAVMPVVNDLQRHLEEVSLYYTEEKYRNDRLRWGRKMHPTLVDGFAAALEATRKASAGVADRRAFWQGVELADIESREGPSAHVRMRKLAYAGQAWVGAIVRGLPAKERAARAAAFDSAYREATEWAAGNSEAMQQIDGAGIFLTGLGELAGLAREHARDATPEDVVAAFNRAVVQFNDMIL